MKTFFLTVLFGPIGFLFGVNGTNNRKRNEKLINELRAIEARRIERETPKKQYKDYKGFWDWING
jgi:hypothetical protein